MTLYLIPVPLGKRRENLVLPEHTLETVRNLNAFIVENIRHAQSFLQWVNHPVPPYNIEFRVLNKKTPEEEVYGFLKLLEKGDVGLFSEAGAPGVADPGALLVKMAHNAGHRVVPLTGPSSILLALMASGMNGQQFAFHGYLPVDESKRKNRITELEQESTRLNQTQIFMETPHRNDPLLESLIGTCQSDTQICIACNLTLPDEQIISSPVYRWKQRKIPSFKGKPAIFLMLSHS
ncbi:MAG: SAM-dependent methyltransferase [Balneolaceae bacterium]